MGTQELVERLHGEAARRQERLSSKRDQQRQKEAGLLRAPEVPRYTPDGHVGRLHVWQRMKVDRQEALRRAQQEEESAPGVPAITEKAKQIAVKPLWERSCDIDKAKRKQLEERREQLKKDEAEVSTFHPQITQRANESTISRNAVEHHEQWTARRNERLEEERKKAKQAEIEGCTFHPELLAKQGHTQAASSTAPAHERLHQDAVRRREDGAVRVLTPSSSPSREPDGGGHQGAGEARPGAAEVDSRGGIFVEDGLDTQSFIDLEFDELIMATVGQNNDLREEGFVVHSHGSGSHGLTMYPSSPQKKQGKTPRSSRLSGASVSPSPAARSISPSLAIRGDANAKDVLFPKGVGQQHSYMPPKKHAKDAAVYTDVFNHLSARVC